MNLKKKIISGTVTALLGMALIGGGTFAYFSDTAEQTNKFAAGTIDLDVDPTVQIPMNEFKPGDWMPRSFELQNNGSLDMKYVDLTTDYTVYTSKNESVLFEFDNKKPGDTFNHSFNMKNNGTLDMKEVTLYSEHTTYNREGTQENNGFANQIVLQRIEVDGKNILQKPMSLEKLSKTPIVLEKNIAANFPAIQVFVEFEFEKTKENQNEFQGNQLELLWTFEAIQADD